MAELLRLDNVSAGHGAARVLSGIDLTLEEGQSLALLGRNGAGKTTLIETVMGLTTLHGGSIHVAGRDMTRAPPHMRARAGLGWAPQERAIFPSLTVTENLAAVARPGPWDAARVFARFPRLAERRANLGDALSGGEQQLLALARALVTNPRLLLLDEPLEGLAPLIAEEVLAAIRKLARDGQAVIIVEQQARKVLAVTDVALVLERGAVALRAASAALAGDAALLDRHLGVGHSRRPE